MCRDSHEWSTYKIGRREAIVLFAVDLTVPGAVHEASSRVEIGHE